MFDPLPSRLTHGICHGHGQWIPGDERGFRARGHRIHSSGDYRHPPPPHEHEGLRRHVRASMTAPPVTLEPDQFTVVGQTFLHKLAIKMQSPVYALSCGPTHLHVLFIPTEPDISRQLGKAKQFASLKCPNHDGQLWAESSDSIPVESIDHAWKAFNYILDHGLKEGAWVWRVDQDTPPPKKWS